MNARALLVVALLAAWATGQEPRAAPPSAAGSAVEGEQVVVRRLNDTVAIRRGVDRSERVLYSWDPTADLRAGDELEQGSGGQSTVVLSLGGLVELFSSGHLIVERLAEAGDVLRFPVVTHAEITSGQRALECWLPGGTRCRFEGGTIVVRTDPGRLRVRNDSGAPVAVDTMLTLEPGVVQGGGRGALVLERGEEVHLPLFRRAPTPALGDDLSQWRGRSLRHSGGFRFTGTATELQVEPAPEGGLDVLTVGGVRITLPEGEALVVAGGPRGPDDGSVPAEPPAEPQAGADRAPPTVPAGQTEISSEQYFQLRLAGRTHAEIAAAGYWVPPTVVANYERWASRQAGPAAEKTTNDETEGSSP